ncbi:MAG: DUF559 domain-containing protein [Anaerolineales bacterium]|nr:DUF559 domain-containing protein [Anaerolineales bacterium]
MKKRHPTDSIAVMNARYLRRTSTESEELLWSVLRGRRLGGYKFRRQYPVGRWIIDFFCLEKMAGVEIDGLIHNKPLVRNHDLLRDEQLKRMGVRILRIPSGKIKENVTVILREILAFLDGRTPSPGVSQERGLGGEEGG